MVPNLLPAKVISKSRKTMLNKGTNHKEILCFSSTESLCDHPDANHSDSQRYEDHVEEYQQVGLLAFPIGCHVLLKLPFFHEVDTCNRQFINNKTTDVNSLWKHFKKTETVGIYTNNHMNNKNHVQLPGLEGVSACIIAKLSIIA